VGGQASLPDPAGIFGGSVTFDDLTPQNLFSSLMGDGGPMPTPPANGGNGGSGGNASSGGNGGNASSGGQTEARSARSGSGGRRTR